MTPVPSWFPPCRLRVVEYPHAPAPRFAVERRDLERGWPEVARYHTLEEAKAHVDREHEADTARRKPYVRDVVYAPRGGTE